MRRIFPGLLLAPMLAAAPPLQVAGVVREGMPPFETERLYRLEGDGCQILRVSEFLTLLRAGERRQLGRLQVTTIKDGYALARLAAPGETYPLKGDLAVRHEMASALPAMPLWAPGEGLRAKDELAARVVKLTVPANPSKEGRHREPIFFLKGSAELSPAALAKLQGWVAAWGADGQWALLVPEDPAVPAALSGARAEALRGALDRLGVHGAELRAQPAAPASRYDSIHVSKEPW